MNRRAFLTGAATAAITLPMAGVYTGRIEPGAVRDGFNETVANATGADEPLVDEGGLVGSSRIDRIEWSVNGQLDLFFEPGHDTEGWSITHESLAEEVENHIVSGESPTFEGPVAIDLRGELARYDEQLPNPNLVVDLWEESTAEDADAQIGDLNFVKHVESFEFTIPDEVDTGHTFSNEGEV